MSEPTPLFPTSSPARALQERFDQAVARVPADLVELMARANYEASRPPGSGRPDWNRCEDAWRAACRREMAAALVAAEAAGYRLSKG